MSSFILSNPSSGLRFGDDGADDDGDGDVVCTWMLLLLLLEVILKVVLPTNWASCCLRSFSSASALMNRTHSSFETEKKM